MYANGLLHIPAIGLLEDKLTSKTPSNNFLYNWTTGQLAMEARVVSRAIVKSQHFAEITVLLDNGDLSTFLGPARKNRPEALKDCLELRKVAVKCTDDLKLLQLKKRKMELEDTTWTMKLG